MCSIFVIPISYLRSCRPLFLKLLINYWQLNCSSVHSYCRDIIGDPREMEPAKFPPVCHLSQPMKDMFIKKQPCNYRRPLLYFSSWSVHSVIDPSLVCIRHPENSIDIRSPRLTSYRVLPFRGSGYGWKPSLFCALFYDDIWSDYL